MSSSSTQKQQQRYRINYNSEQSRNTNAYFDREDYHQRSLFKKSNYWNENFHRSNDDFYTNHYYQHQNISYPSSSRRLRKERQIKTEQQRNTKSNFSSSSSSNNNYSYYDNIPPRHRLQKLNDKRKQNPRHPQESKPNPVKIDELNHPNSLKKDEQQPTKPLQSISSSSTNSDSSNNPESNHRKDLHAKNLAAATAAIAARQQNSLQQTNLGMVQALMNSLILQQQQQPSNSQSTAQLQHQLTNALVGIMIQQRLKETALQAQAQQIQAALPTLLAAQALVYQQQQQQGQLTPHTQQQTQSILTPSIAHPGTKFNNRPLVKFPVIRPTMSSLSSATMIPMIRPPITTNLSRHRLGTHSQQMCSTTSLPTYQQVQEIERGISLDEAIHLKNAIDIAHANATSNIVDTEAVSSTNIIAE